MARVVITMPAYRAEATLEKTVAAIPPALADELILVDDASPDRTAEIARSLGISVHVHPQNRGYGGNQKTCYTMAIASNADIVVMLHPDYQYEPKSVPLLIAPILAKEADMTFGSRFAGLGDPMGGGMPLYRFVGNRITTTLENLLLGSRFSEMHSGMRAYTRQCLLTLPFLSYSEDFGFDTQLMVDAVTTGQRVVEVPIPTRYTKESSSISIARSLKYVGHSLVHTAKKSAARGRRGRRYPVAVTRATQDIRGDEQHASAGRRGWTSPARDDAGARPLDAKQVLDVVDGYVLPGRRVLQLDAKGVVEEAPVLERWQDVGSESLRGDDKADVGLILHHLDLMPDPGGALRTLRGAVDKNGLIAFGVTVAARYRGQDRADAEKVSALLRESGFQMVRWTRIRGSDRSGRQTLVVARPKTR